MVVYSNHSWMVVLTTLKGSILRRIAPRLLMITLLAVAIVFVEKSYPEIFLNVSATPLTLLGLSLSIFMSFRNSACYERWWEGRKMWGLIIIEARAFGRETVCIEGHPLREEILKMLCAFAHALNAHLKRQDEWAVAKPWMANQDLNYVDNLSDTILNEISRRLWDLRKEDAISEWHCLELERRLRSISEAHANCERIKNTPLPFPYSLLLHRTTFIFCVLLPFAMAQPLGWLAPLITTIVSYTFFGLDAIGNELEDPFGNDVNDLPTNAMVRVIERDVHRALGQELPPALKPVNHVLS